jgi:hypothetical protein
MSDVAEVIGEELKRALVEEAGAAATSLTPEDKEAIAMAVAYLPLLAARHAAGEYVAEELTKPRAILANFAAVSVLVIAKAAARLQGRAEAALSEAGRWLGMLARELLLGALGGV